MAQPVRGYGMGRVTSPSCVSIPWCWRLGATGLVIHVPRDGGGVCLSGIFYPFPEERVWGEGRAPSREASPTLMGCPSAP